MEGEFHIFNSEDAFLQWADEIVNCWDWNKGIAVKSELDIGTRSLAQNAAMHKHFTNIANGLNNLGLPQKVVMAEFKEIEKEWSPGSVKYDLYHRMMFALTGKTSTTLLNKMEVTEIDHHLDMWFAAKFPSFQWPVFPHKDRIRDA